MLDKLNDPALGRGMLHKVQDAAVRAAERLGRPPLIMEVCGTHTAAFSRYGLRTLLKGLVELRSGPGCPVCVTSAGEIEMILALSRLPGVIIATYGDMMRVPGISSSLERERAVGACVQVIYSPAGALELAHNMPDREVVYIGVGFETTTPLSALTMQQGATLGLKNFSILSVHKTMPPAIRTLLSGDKVQVDGMLLPGHVAAVTGSSAFDFIGGEFGLPAVVTGFTPVDLLDALHLLLQQIASGDSATVNGYRWVVREQGNQAAQQAMESCFNRGKGSWRGLGVIPDSGLSWRGQWAAWDAAQKFGVSPPQVSQAPGCRCGELLRGLILPPQCAAFGRLCTPVAPLGPCMVSAEGACAAYYRYELKEAR